jgi:hypothetical protein
MGRSYRHGHLLLRSVASIGKKQAGKGDNRSLYETEHMTDQFTFDLKRLLTAFQKTWAEREAFRTKHKIEASRHTANWENILQACQTNAQELFAPALSDLDNYVPLTLVIEKLLERLEGVGKATEPSNVTSAETHRDAA